PRRTRRRSGRLCARSTCPPARRRAPRVRARARLASRSSLVTGLARSRENGRVRIFSGIQPTGDKHLGNLIGGFQQYAATQEQGEGFFCIVDLHSISVEYEPEELRNRTLDLAAMLFATGLDPERSVVFCQSHVTAHAEANWLLSGVASYGQLGRMT